MFLGRHFDGLSIESTALPDRGELLVVHHVDHDPCHSLTVLPETHRHGHVGHVVDEVDCAVQWIHDPDSSTFPTGSPLFLSQDLVVGSLAGQDGSDGVLGGGIDGGYRIHFALHVDVGGA